MEHLEIISRENVGPSSPTPQNLRSFKVSLLDQVIPCVLVPLFLYYEDAYTEINGSDSFISQTTHHLKNTLSVILTRFYTLAGRANPDNLSIDCNDEGVPFVVVKFRGANLSDFLRDLSGRRFVLPCDITKHDDRSVVQIQINHFDCGGVAVASVFWHRAADAPTFASFLKSWAATARGVWDLPACPNYIFPSLFPQAEAGEEARIQTPNSQLAAAAVRKGKSALRRYVFDGAAVAALKKRSGLQRCTRVEVVSALIWKCFMAASLANNEASASVMIHAVNLRRRAQPPFPADCFGNFQGLAATSSDGGGGEDLGSLVMKMRDSLRKIDGDYVSRMRGEGGIEGYLENGEGMMSSIAEGAEIVYVSSWCNLGFNEVDFGWGKPVRVGTYGGEGNDDIGVFANGVSLMDGRDGDGKGIDVGLIIDQRYVSAFDQLLQQASIDATSQSSSA